MPWNTTPDGTEPSRRERTPCCFASQEQTEMMHTHQMLQSSNHASGWFQILNRTLLSAPFHEHSNAASSGRGGAGAPAQV